MDTPVVRLLQRDLGPDPEHSLLSVEGAGNAPVEHARCDGTLLITDAGSSTNLGTCGSCNQAQAWPSLHAAMLDSTR